MQHRTGSNPHEPTSDNKCSRVWKFILRNASYQRLPEAFVPHSKLCAWIATPQGQTSNWLLRGVIQFSSTRNYYTMKHRYSRSSEWIPIQESDVYKIQEYTTQPLPINGVRHLHETSNPVPLQKVGYKIDVPDLIEDYHMALWQAENEANHDPELELKEAARKKRKRELADEYLLRLAEDEMSAPREMYTTDYSGKRTYIGTSYPGGRIDTPYNKNLGRFN